MIRVSKHAVARYQERIASVDVAEVRRRILEHSSVLEIAASFGAPVVRLGDGVGLVIKRRCVTTVLAPQMRLGPVA